MAIHFLMESWQVVQNYIHLAFVMSFFVCVSVCEGGEEKMRLFEEGKKCLKLHMFVIQT